MPSERQRPPALAQAFRIALYSHDTMGLGHTRRNLLLAEAIAAANPQADILLITGGREATLAAQDSNIDFITLPALHKDAQGQYGPRRFNLSLPELIRLRAHTIRAALAAFEPDVLIVDNVPRGAVRELDPALDYLRAQGHTRCVLGLREVLDEPEVVRSEWRRAKNEAVIRAYYDAVWVYGDPVVYDMLNEYRFAPDITEKIRYTGYLDQRRRLDFTSDDHGDPLACLELPPGRLALCLLGGGQDGAQLADAFAQAALPAKTNGVIVAGPFMPRAVLHRLQQQVDRDPRMRVVTYLPEPILLLDRTNCVVSMGGYNTTCELLSFEKPALIVPRVRPRREQMIRAERLRDLGVVEVLHPDRLSPQTISAWLAQEHVPPRVRGRIDLDGLSRVPSLLDDLLATPAPRRVEEKEFAHGLA
jgi:predicted glycosyltransferase